MCWPLLPGSGANLHTSLICDGNNEILASNALLAEFRKLVFIFRKTKTAIRPPFTKIIRRLILWPWPDEEELTCDVLRYSTSHWFWTIFLWIQHPFLFQVMAHAAARYTSFFQTCKNNLLKAEHCIWFNYKSLLNQKRLLVTWNRIYLFQGKCWGWKNDLSALDTMTYTFGSPRRYYSLN